MTHPFPDILLTTSPFSSSLPTPPASLIKLSDFGLSRFIDPAQPSLTTLCGSESYAAPELVTGRPYDGRDTDAWACGVVLYALTARRLPFDRAMSRERDGAHNEARSQVVHSKAERRALLMRIAKAEYAWPGDYEPLHEGEGPLRGTQLVQSAGVRRVVEKLLVRNAAKRTRVIDLWEDPWMRGEGAPGLPLVVAHGNVKEPESADASAESDVMPVFGRAFDAKLEGDDDVDVDADDEDDDGLIVDAQDIGPGSVAHQEH